MARKATSPRSKRTVKASPKGNGSRATRTRKTPLKRIPRNIRFDLTGHRYGRLTVLGFAGFRGEAPMWLCKCDCGNVHEYYRTNLRSGTSTQCRECCRQYHIDRSTRHGMWGSPTYRTWERVRRHPQVCRRWHDFQKFLEDVGEKPSDQHHLVRKNTKQGFKPSNAHWVHASEARRSGGKTRILTYKGKSQSLSAWAAEAGISRQALSGRLDSGQTLRQALTTPKKR